METCKDLIGGEWVGSGDHASFETRNPAAPDEVLAVFPSATAADAAQAAAAAAEAFPAWRATPAPNRGAILFKAAELLTERLDSVARTLTREEGKTLAEATGEVVRARDILRYFGGEGWRRGGEVLPPNAPNGMLFSRREPLGVVAAITPWNFPIADPRLEDRPGARLRQHRRLQAGQRHAAHGAAPGGVPRRRRPAGRRAQLRHRLGLRGGRGAVRRPRGAGPHLHGVARHRRAHLRARDGALRARPAGDGRQEPDHRARRRRPRAGRQAGGDGRLRPHRPELHRHQPGDREEGIADRFAAALAEAANALSVGDGLAGGRADGPGRERGPARDRPRLRAHRPRGGGGAAGRRRARRRRRPLPPPHGVRRRRGPQSPGPGGSSARSSASSAPGTSTTPSSRPTPSATAWPRASSPTTSAAP